MERWKCKILYGRILLYGFFYLYIGFPFSKKEPYVLFLFYDNWIMMFGTRILVL